MPCLVKRLLSPVKEVVIFKPLGSKTATEKPPKVHVIRPVVESQTPRIVDIRGEFSRQTVIELFARQVLLYLLDPYVLLDL
jgi:hypothetical protein